METIQHWIETNPNGYAAGLLAAFILTAVVAEVIIRRVILGLVRNTATDLDDEIVKRFRAPLILSLTFVGLHVALNASTLDLLAADILAVLLTTFAVMLWADAVVKVIGAAASRTATDLDDKVIARLRRPLAATVLAGGGHFVVASLEVAPLVARITDAVLVTLAALAWTDGVLRIIRGLTERTKTELDDEAVDRLRGPLAVTVALIGVRVVLATLELGETALFVSRGLLITVAVLVWSRAGIAIGRAVLAALGRRGEEHQLVQPRTLPLFDIMFQIVVIAGAAYAILLAWHIDVTAWLASAGIVGIAVGFAAKDTLANLFAGIFIIADAPFKVGDYVLLDAGERGRVTHIGIRSTRLLTRDDIEVTIPNATLGNSKIVNETGGPHDMERVRVNIGVAYGSDIDLVRQVLLDIATGSEYLVQKPPPVVRFREFGASSLDFQLMGWIPEPALRGRTLDELNTAIYKKFAEQSIEIPFPQRDLWVKELPR